MDSESKNDNSRIVLAAILIFVGIIWLLTKIGFYIDLSWIHLNNFFYPIRHLFRSFGNFVFSWPMILIIVGLLLMAGKRSVGIVLIVVGGIFILPKLFLIPGLSISLLLPVFLIGVGIAMVVRKI